MTTTAEVGEIFIMLLFAAHASFKLCKLCVKLWIRAQSHGEEKETFWDNSTYVLLRVTLHLLILFFETDAKDLVEHTMDSIPALPFVRFTFTMTLASVLVANLAAIPIATVAEFIIKYISLGCKIARYLMLTKPDERFRNPPQKVLIVHGSIGAGHKRAAQALSDTFKERYPALEVKVIDIVDFAGPTFNAMYKRGYLSLAEKTWGSHLVGYIFDASNQSQAGWFSRLVQESFLLDFFSYIYNFRPDIIVNTHFLAPEIIAALRRRGLIRLPQVTVVTDFDAHAFWANYPCEAFFVGQSGAGGNLTHVNSSISEDRIFVTGIPCVPVFSTIGSRESCLKATGLRGEEGRPVVLLTAR